MHVSITDWLGGIYTPNLYYIMTSMPLPARNILRIFWAVGHFMGWNVKIVYSIRFVLGTLSRRSSATFGSAPNLRGDFGLRYPSASSEDLRPHYLTFGRWVNLRALATAGTFGFIRRHSAALLDLRLVGQSPGTGVRQYLRLPSCDLGNLRFMR